jgi:spore maturation protein CgeB
MAERPIRILYYFAEQNTYMYQWQRFHIFEELSHYNVTFEVFNPLNYSTIELAWDSLIKHVKTNQGKYDLFFNCTGDRQMSKEVVLEIKKLGLSTLLICFDNLHAPYMHKNIAPAFDLVWLTSSETENMFKKWGAKTIFQPYAANPYLFKPSEKEEILSIGFIGTPYGTRIPRINQLLQNRLPVSVYADSLVKKNHQPLHISKKIPIKDKFNDILTQLRFPIGRKIFYSEMKKKFMVPEANFKLQESDLLIKNPSVSFEEMSELFSQHALSINITDIWNTYLLNKPVYKLHLRTFEIPMSGGLQITSYTDELASYFEENKEIIFFRSNEELIEKSQFYLKPENTALRRQIKSLACIRAKSEHTWHKRFEIVLGRLRLNI